MPHPNQLFYGDNLTVLREYIPASSVDLVYLDPPFNSRADYRGPQRLVFVVGAERPLC